MNSESVDLSMSGYPFLELQNISVAREDVIVLHSLCLTIHSGENVAILGPNGSGKSTLIKIITRELYPVMSDEPRIFRMWGNEQWNVFNLRSKLGIVSNDLQAMFSRDISGKEVLLSGFFSSIGLFHHKITPDMEQKINEVADFLGIVHLMNRSILRMSSGESRRVLIGRALVHSPQALILDEPTSNLDLCALHSLRGYLRKIAHSGIAIILVTHQLHDIIPEIHRVIMLKDGKIVLDGQKEKILTKQHISEVFSIPVQIHLEEGYFFASGY